MECELEDNSLTPITFPVNAEEFSAVQMHQNEVKAVLDIDRWLVSREDALDCRPWKYSRTETWESG